MKGVKRMQHRDNAKLHGIRAPLQQKEKCTFIT